MARGRIEFIVSAEVDTGDETPMEAIIEELALSVVVLSKEVIMIEPPPTVGVFDPQLVVVREPD